MVGSDDSLSKALLFHFHSFLMSKIPMRLRSAIVLGFCGILAFAAAGLHTAGARESAGFAGFMGLKIENPLTAMGRQIAAAARQQGTYFARLNEASAPPVPRVASQFPYGDDPAFWPQEAVALGHNQTKTDNTGWQADDGLNYRMSNDVALTGGYQYRSSDDLDFGGYDVDYKGHELRFGVKIKLPYD